MINPTNVRGLILRGLQEAVDNSLSNTALVSMLVGYGIQTNKHDIREQIQYLADKKYVRYQVIYKDLVHVQLTAEGVDLLEGRVADPGVTLSPQE